MGLRSLPLCLLVVAFSYLSSPPALEAGEVVFTFDEDFDAFRTTSQNVTHEAPHTNELRVERAAAPVRVVWFANQVLGTVLAFDAATRSRLGEYWTAPDGLSRSPTPLAIDRRGNLWVGNQDESSGGQGSLTQVGLVVGGRFCDPELETIECRVPPFVYLGFPWDGPLHTSPWWGVPGASGILDWPDDAVLHYLRTGATNVHHVSLDAGGSVWVGGYPNAPGLFEKRDGKTGAPLGTFSAAQIGCGGFGGLVDSRNVLWSASPQEGKLLRYDLIAGSGACLDLPGSFAVAVDTPGFVWVSMGSRGTVAKLSPEGVLQPGFPKPAGSSFAGAVAVTPRDNHVWVADPDAGVVNRPDSQGNRLKSIPVGLTPTGLAVDGLGYVWVALGGFEPYTQDFGLRIDPEGGPDRLGRVELGVELDDRSSFGEYEESSRYNVVAGEVPAGTLLPQGIWSVVLAGDSPSTVWRRVIWNTEPEGSEPPGTQIRVEARTTPEYRDELAFETFQPVDNGTPLSLNGRYIEVRVTLKAADDVTPVLSDLRVEVSDSTLGPPLQVSLLEVGQQSATFVWQTPDLTTSTIRYGLTSISEQAVTDLNPVTGHQVTVGGLQPGRRYLFRARSRATRGTLGTLESPLGEFVTPPALPQALGVALVQDVGVTKAYVTLHNRTGALLRDVRLTRGVLRGTNTASASLPLPSLGDILNRESRTTVLVFPASAGPPDTQALLSVGWQSSVGSASASYRVTLPGGNTP